MFDIDPVSFGFQNSNCWRLNGRYPNPFLDAASMMMPTNMQGALLWGEYATNANGVYREALRRIVAYCVTEPKVVEVSEESPVGKEIHRKYYNILDTDHLNIKNFLHVVGINYFAYGNVFSSVHTGFTRFLRCNRCGVEIPFDTIANPNRSYDFKFTNMEFNAWCPMCKCNKTWEPKDRYSDKPEDVFLGIWNPHEIEIRYDKFTRRKRYIWRIPADYKSEIRRGDPLTLAGCPMDILKCIKHDRNLLFSDKFIFHACDEALAGLDMQGWGMPKVIANFRQIIRMQTIDKFNEVLAQDYLVPFRVVSPIQNAPDPSMDPMRNTDLGDFSTHMQQMFRARELDPAAFHVSPYPLQYQTLAGDAAKFLPKEMVSMAEDNLLTAAGIPVELYRGTLTVQTAPMALRLFEQFWRPLVSMFDQLLTFVGQKAGVYLGWEPVRIKLQPITHIDDFARQAAKLQLASAGMVSQTTALASIGLNKEEEMKLQMDENRLAQELEQKMQEDMESQQQATGMFQPAVNQVIGGIMQQQEQAAQQQQGGGQPLQPQFGAFGGQQQPGGGAMPSNMMQIMPASMPGVGGQIEAVINQMLTAPMTAMEDYYAVAQQMADFMISLGPNRAHGLRVLKRMDQSGMIHTLVKGIIEDADQAASTEGRHMVQQQQQQEKMGSWIPSWYNNRQFFDR